MTYSTATVRADQFLEYPGRPVISMSLLLIGGGKDQQPQFLQAGDRPGVLNRE